MSMVLDYDLQFKGLEGTDATEYRRQGFLVTQPLFRRWNTAKLQRVKVLL